MARHVAGRLWRSWPSGAQVENDPIRTLSVLVGMPHQQLMRPFPVVSGQAALASILFDARLRQRVPDDDQGRADDLRALHFFR